jgi:hypothetical protein
LLKKNVITNVKEMLTKFAEDPSETLYTTSWELADADSVWIVEFELSGWEQLADEQITASSEYSATYKASNGRIDQASGYAWTPDINDKTPWIQVDFREHQDPRKI